MAKGDAERAREQINNQGNIAQTSMDRLQSNLYDPNRQMRQNYNLGTAMNLSDYQDIMGGYRDIYNSPGAGGGSSGGGGSIGDNSYGGYQSLAGGKYAGWDPLFRGAFSDAIGGFGDFAKTGGFTDQNLQDLRARAVNPTRAVYSNAQANLDRNRSLQGFSPNYAAATSKMARDLAYGISDANVNANASIAQMVQQGKLAGLQGLTSAGGMGQGLSTDIDALNLQAMLAGLQGMVGIDSARSAASRASSSADTYARLNALGGMQDLYGTTPGLSNMFGNQVIASGDQLLQAQGLQNNLGLGTMGAQYNAGLLPGNGQLAMGNIGWGLDLGSQIAGSLVGMGGGGGGNTGLGGMPGVNITNPYLPRY